MSETYSLEDVLAEVAVLRADVEEGMLTTLVEFLLTAINKKCGEFGIGFSITSDDLKSPVKEKR